LPGGAAAVVFDLDGTLVDTLPDLWAALVEALRSIGAGDVPADVVRSSLHGGLEATALAALDYLDLPQQRLGPLVEAYGHCYEARDHRGCVPYDGVADCLAALGALRMPMAVCTNKRVAQAEQLLRRTGLRPHFGVVVGPETTSHPKPHPRPLLHAVDALGAEPRAALLVGDSIVDAECARAAGVPFVLHRGGYGADAVPRAWVAAGFDRYAELQPMLSAGHDAQDLMALRA
jgi:phosphoglycolate phosphatase